MRRILLTVAAGFAGAVVTLFAPSSAAAVDCHPSYTPCVPDKGSNASAVNCPDLATQVKVIGPDVYRLDSDNDGIGCEDNPPIPAGQPSTSGSASAKPSTSSSSAPPAAAGEGGATLPKTGVDATVAAAVGAGLLAAGGAVFVVTRRRRFRFEV